MPFLNAEKAFFCDKLPDSSSKEIIMKFGEPLDGLTWVSEEVIIYQGIKCKLTGLFDQIFDAKKQNPSAIVLSRVGDFYEAFFDDAKIVSRALDLTLTSRSRGVEGEDIPMAGVPHRAINEYLFQLVEQGFKVTMVDQLEDPAKVPAGKIVKRGITQIITPGTLCDERPGNDKNARFLSAIVWLDAAKSKTNKKSDASDNMPICALSSLDISTGYCTMTEVSSLQSLQSELMRLNVREVISHHTSQDEALQNLMRGIPVTFRERDLFVQQELLDRWMADDDNGDNDYTFMSKDKFLSFIALIEQAQFKQSGLVIESFCGLLLYLRDLHLPITANIEQIYPYRAESFMQIDAATFQNLEIYSTLRGNKKSGCLLSEIDDTVTSSGARLLQNWLAYPLKECKAILTRLDAVEDLFNHFECRDELRKKLRETADLERLSTKLANDRIVPSEFILLKNTLKILPEIAELCARCDSAYLKRASTQLASLETLADTIENALISEAPSNLNDTKFFKLGYDQALDECCRLTDNGQQWLLDYESRQRKETGINSLKIKFVNNFNYVIDVTKSNLSLVPEHYIRRQTLTGSERFTTPELQEYEELLLNAASRRTERELELYRELVKYAAGHISVLVKNARILAHIDVLCSLAHTAHHRNYTRPVIDESRAFALVNARHPVVERFLPKGERFVPNDIRLDDNGRLMIITGPNMAGKSTVIRQAAIITLMAQMGSFVPAEAAHIGLVDRIFSRVGASDNLALGQSTFMVEMTETANILQNATEKSLVILDEIGRGTSTYDGLSLAWAIAEYLHSKIGARALFATHYHELTELANVMPGVKNASIAAKEYKKDIIFLRKLVDGAANRSYGIQVARLAGIPDSVLERANQILETLEENAHRELVTRECQPAPVEKSQPAMQRSLFGEAEAQDAVSDSRTAELCSELQSLSLDAMTPIQALNWLYKWQKKMRFQGRTIG